MPQRGHDAHEPGLPHLRQRAAGRAEAVPAVPVEERGGVGHDPALLLGEDDDGVAQPDRARLRRPASGRARGLAAGGAGGQRRRRLGARRRHVLVDGEQRPVVVEPEQQRLGGRAAPRRAGRSRAGRPPGARRRCPPRPRAPPGRRARRHPGGVAPAPVAGAVEPRAGERGHDSAGTTSAASSSSASVSRCRRCWSITRSTPASAYSRRRSAICAGRARRPAVVGREAGRRRGARARSRTVAVVRPDHEAVHEREAQRVGVAPRALAALPQALAGSPPRRPARRGRRCTRRPSAPRGRRSAAPPRRP